MNIGRNSLIICFIVFLCAVITGKAENNDKSNYYDFGKQFYTEAHIVGDKGADSVEAVIFFRFSYSIMTFAKSTDIKANGSKYTAYPKIFIDFRDTTGLIKKREQWTDTVVTANYDSTKSKSFYYPGFVKVILPRNITSVNIDFRNDQLSTLKKEKLILGPIQGYGSSYILKPILVSASNDNNNPSTSPVIDGIVKDEYQPFILGGSVDFRSNNAHLLFPVKYKRGNDSYNYIIEYLPDKPEDLWGRSEPLTGQARARMSDTPGLNSNTRGGITLTLQNNSVTVEAGDYTPGFLEIPIPATFMYPGNYILKVASANETKDSLSFYFKVEWVDMPVSLRNPDYAAEMMYYLLTDEEHEELESGSRLEVLRKIWNYWKNSDPTKFTIYNEAMAAYFSRADYAFFNYKSISEKDGAKTDRGKIYILKGAPGEIKRKLDEDKTIEEWYYKNLKQVYIFETNSGGKYKLKRIDNIAKK